MKSDQKGSIIGVILFIFVIIGILLFIAIKTEDQVFRLMNNYIDETMIEKMSNFFSIFFK